MIYGGFTGAWVAVAGIAGGFDSTAEKRNPSHKPQNQHPRRQANNRHTSRAPMVRRDLSRTVRPPPTRPPARGGTHTGTYAVPAGRTAARFSFKAVSGIGHRSGNRLDGISFGTAYPPPRNGNGNTSGNTPKQNQIKKNSMSRKTQTPPRKALDRLTAAVTSILMLIPLAA